MVGEHGGMHQHNPKYRTKLCRNFPLGTCRYGEHCSYLHVSAAPAPVQRPTYPNLSAVAQSIFQPCNRIFPSDLISYEPLYTAWPPEVPRATPMRSSRPEAPKRSSSRVPSHGAHVERWRLTVDTSRALGGVAQPAAPPTTPTSVAATKPESASRVMRKETVHPRQGGSSQASSSRTELPRPKRSSASASERAQKRNQFFRTKPCRFFAEPTGCVKGDRCNFIHENPPEDGQQPVGLVAPAEAAWESEVESAADSSVQGELSPSTAATSEVPTSASVHGGSPKRNFYPVTWRVVGGGVTLGGKREVCQNFIAGWCPEGADCKYAHPDNSDEEECVAGHPEAPLFSPLSPISPILVPYPYIYGPLISPVQPFALPAMPGPAPPSPSPVIQPVPTPKARHSGKNSLTGLTIITGVAQPTPQAYAPHRTVDGSTLLDRDPPDGSYRAENAWAARAIPRPLSTPPTPAHTGQEVGIAKLFAAEMP